MDAFSPIIARARCSRGACNLKQFGNNILRIVYSAVHIIYIKEGWAPYAAVVRLGASRASDLVSRGCISPSGRLLIISFSLRTASLDKERREKRIKKKKRNRRVPRGVDVRQLGCIDYRTMRNL